MDKLEFLISNFNQLIIEFYLLLDNTIIEPVEVAKGLDDLKEKSLKLQQLLKNIKHSQQIFPNQDKSLIDIATMLYQVFGLRQYRKNKYLIEINLSQVEAFKNLLEDLRHQLIPQRASINFRRRKNNLVLTCIINHNVLQNIPSIIQTTEMLKILAKYLKGRVRVTQSSSKDIIYLTVSFIIITPAKMPV